MSDPFSEAPAPLWGSLADVRSIETSPALAASTVSRIFGERGASVAAWCAIYAHHDGDLARYRLWLSAFMHLKAPDARPS